MATRALSKPVDLQELLTGVAMLELKAVNAGIEYGQLWMNQMAKLSTIANDTLTAMQEDKASLAETAKRLNEFGRQNADAFTELSGRLSQRYFQEVARLTKTVEPREAARRPKKRAARSAGAKPSASKA
jgi:hypothetical protein